MAISRSRQYNLQCAADDAAVIAEEIETLGKLLDKFYEKYDEELGSRLTALIPNHELFGPGTALPIYKFARSLEPPSD
jgi:hypothetical protein